MKRGYSSFEPPPSPSGLKDHLTIPFWKSAWKGTRGKSNERPEILFPGPRYSIPGWVTSNYQIPPSKSKPRLPPPPHALFVRERGSIFTGNLQQVLISLMNPSPASGFSCLESSRIFCHPALTPPFASHFTFLRQSHSDYEGFYYYAGYRASFRSSIKSTSTAPSNQDESIKKCN